MTFKRRTKELNLLLMWSM